MAGTLKERLDTINKNRIYLSGGERKTLGSYKQMCRNLKEESGQLGGESHVSPNGLKHAKAWANKIIAIYGLNFTS